MTWFFSITDHGSLHIYAPLSICVTSWNRSHELAGRLKTDLWTELFGGQLEGGDNLLGQNSSIREPEWEEWDLRNECVVRYHHSDWTEQGLQPKNTVNVGHSAWNQPVIFFTPFNSYDIWHTNWNWVIFTSVKFQTIKWNMCRMCAY